MSGHGRHTSKHAPTLTTISSRVCSDPGPQPITSRQPSMADEIKSDTRRYVRALGPFNGYHLGLRKTPVLVFNLNVGGGFVNFTDEQPAGATFVLTIELPPEGRITVKAETVYRDPSGIAVRFVDLDADAAGRLARAVERGRAQHAAT